MALALHNQPYVRFNIHTLQNLNARPYLDDWHNQTHLQHNAFAPQNFGNAWYIPFIPPNFNNEWHHVFTPQNLGNEWYDVFAPQNSDDAFAAKLWWWYVRTILYRMLRKTAMTLLHPKTSVMLWTWQETLLSYKTWSRLHAACDTSMTPPHKYKAWNNLDRRCIKCTTRSRNRTFKEPLRTTTYFEHTGQKR